jgi:formylglycine-generating enzyme
MPYRLPLKNRPLRSFFAVCTLGFLATPLLTRCAAPTALTVTVYAEVDCAKKPVSGISIASGVEALAGRAFSATSSQCSPDGNLGSVVLFPSGSKDSRVAVQVVVRPDGGDPATCIQSAGAKGCITSRRELKLIPGENLQMRIDLRLSCLDIPCELATSCALGACVSAKTTCEPNCDEASFLAQANKAPPLAPPSCQGLPKTCGPTKNEDCCLAPAVPGGTFFRSFDNVTFTDKSNPATVSAFRLDRFEATWGRFEKFLAAYPNNVPNVGAGKNPNNADDQGWQQRFTDTLLGIAPTASALRERMLMKRASYKLPVPAPATEPATGSSWTAALAFCIWDGGRLPTGAEWNYAASGGDEQRVYPWSAPATDSTIAATQANISLSGGALAGVGSRSPAGDGRWGHADLAGNAWEWVVSPGGTTLVNPCKDCTVYPAPASIAAGLRGGSALSPVAGNQDAIVSRLEESAWTESDPTFGFRCARPR